DLVLAAHFATGRARGRESRAEGDRRYAEEPRSYRGDRPGLVGGAPDRRLQGRPTTTRRRQSPRYAGLRARTLRAEMTWSIIARDNATGQFGIAVATRFFAVGARVPHIAAGIGGWRLLREGLEPRDIVETLIAADAGHQSRQLHIMDAAGRIASHTGRECVDWCGHIEGNGFSIAGNMLAGASV